LDGRPGHSGGPVPGSRSAGAGARSEIGRPARVQDLAVHDRQGPHHRSPAPEAASSQLGRTHGGGRLGPALRACQRWAICPGYRGAARGGRTRHGGNERPAHRVPRDRGPSLPGGAWAGGDRDPYQTPVGHGEVAPVPCLEYADGSHERSAAMTQSSHQEIRRLIATSADDLSEAQQALLHAHLQHCGSCRDYAAATAEIVRALRGIPVAADSRLVLNTQARVRARAFALRQRQQWLTLVALACPFVGLSAAITTPLVWRAFDWIGTHAGLSRPVWQAGFAIYSMVPALLVSVLLLFRGTHLANGGYSRESS